MSLFHVQRLVFRFGEYFQIFRAVVRFIMVTVMDNFGIVKRTSEHLLGNHNMFQHVTVARPRMVGYAQADIAHLVKGSPAFPVGGRCTFTAFSPTRMRTKPFCSVFGCDVKGRTTLVAVPGIGNVGISHFNLLYRLIWLGLRELLTQFRGPLSFYHKEVIV